MSSTVTIPSKISTIWASGATSGDIHSPIPVPDQTGVDQQLASWTTGFPPITMMLQSAGGLPPYGQDINGALNALSAVTRYSCAGGMFPFDATFAGLIGGYPHNAVLVSNDGLSAYINVLDGNTTDFNSTPSSIGVSWMPFDGQCLINSLNPYLMNNLVQDIKFLTWAVGGESISGYAGTTSVVAGNGYSMNAAGFWTTVSAMGAVNSVVSNNTLVTVTNITGKGVLTNLFLPGFTSAGNTVTVQVTVDGGTMQSLTFTAINATDRFFSGALSVNSADLGLTGTPDIEGGLAQRIPASTNGIPLIQPNCMLGRVPCFAFNTSLLIKMSVSAVNTANYRNNCGAVYYLHP